MRFASAARLCLGLTLVSCIACIAQAKPEFLEVYRAHYGLKDGTKLGDASCTNCHTQPPRRNPFGKDIEHEYEASPGGQLTAAMLDSVGSKDSDGDGFSNADEIKADTLPGDPASKPVGPATTGSEGQGASATPATESPSGIDWEEQINPKHTFHPLIVHFPIGLFLFGAFLEVLGKRRGESKLREFALWNLGFGAIFGVLGAVTGLIAIFRLGLSFSGIALLHLIIAGAAAVLMVVIALWRRKDMPDTAAYWTVLALTCLAIAVGGHLGATMVFNPETLAFVGLRL
ncbi:MAG: DUF2231 domain-containing protein [Fimbriimonadaceae bacterium]|nr:DUF2231 domain-containing protein [Fimbriimonadaceae bacterium]